MTVKTLARHFGVQAPAYMEWITSFSPFRKGEKFHIRKNLRKRCTRLNKGTDVPVPNDDPSFNEIMDIMQAKKRAQAHLSVQDNRAILHYAMLTAATLGIVTPKNWKQARQ